MRRALGKGLSQLIAEQFEGGTTEVPVDVIRPNPRQPRTRFSEDALEDLSRSIKQHGVVSPLVVRPQADGTYELVAGERRLRAAKLAGLDSVPVIIRSSDNQDSLEVALVENLQREDINAMECARAYRKLMDEFQLTQEQVSERVGKSRTVIANTLRLLRLPPRVQESLEESRITEGHARALLAFENQDQQLALLDQILEKGLTVREVEKASKAKPNAGTSKPSKAEGAALDPNLKAVEEGLSTFLGAPVKISPGPVGGKLTIDYYSDDDLQRVLEVLGFSL